MAADAKNLKRLLAVASEQMSRATGVAHSKVLYYQSETADLRMVAGKGWKPGMIDHALLAIDMASPPGRCYQTRAVVNVGNLAESREFRYDPILKEHGILSVLQAPVSVDGVVWGVVEVDSTDPDAFDEDDEQFLQAFGLVLALAVRHRQAQQEREESAEAAGRLLERADTLMGEQSHRVRNYFQMILTLIGSRSAAADNDRMRAEYADLMERVAAIGLAHDLLKIDKGQSTVNAATYLEALCGGMERTLGIGPKISREFETIDLRSDRAVPLGLIANELLTNAFKHAGVGRPEAAIAVRFLAEPGSQEAVLEVKDNGPGMGKPRAGSQGLRLIRSLTGQLSGRIEFDSSSSGTTVRTIFPLVE